MHATRLLLQMPLDLRHVHLLSKLLLHLDPLYILHLRGRVLLRTVPLRIHLPPLILRSFAPGRLSPLPSENWAHHERPIWERNPPH